MSKRKLTLSSDLTAITQAIGIATSDSEFQVSLLVNSILSVKLTLSKSIEKINSSPLASFPCFSSVTDNEEQILLIKNKNKGAALFNNQAQFDYLIVITSLEPFSALAELISKLKSTKTVSFVSEIEAGKLTNLKSYL